MMQIFILGATGSIGSAVTKEVIRAGHRVVALSRSPASDERLKRWGARPLRGDLNRPDAWVDIIAECDGIIHAAATFGDDMGAVDRAVMQALERVAARVGHVPRFVYTGGCWLYGETGAEIADETHPFDPLPAFAWMVENGTALLASKSFSSAVLHPAMVYSAQGGVFARHLAAARARERVEIWGDARTRWPIVHCDDLAVAYRLLIERRDLNGYFNASAQIGVEIGQVVEALNVRFGNPCEALVRSVADMVAEHGDWAAGPALDQQMSADRLEREAGWVPKYVDFRETDLFE